MPWLIGKDDVDEVRQFWPTVDEVEPDALVVLLASDQVQCAAFAPALAVDALVPVHYLQAQALQARALYRSTHANTQDGIGAEGFTVTVFPMDWTVKNLLRPKTAVPVIA